VPDFEISIAGGKLAAGTGDHGAVRRVLRGLRKSRRWQGVEVRGDADGVKGEHLSRGRNMWLYDLWLIERLLGKIEAFVRET
jgi:hypothetical protein